MAHCSAGGPAAGRSGDGGRCHRAGLVGGGHRLGSLGDGRACAGRAEPAGLGPGEASRLGTNRAAPPTGHPVAVDAVGPAGAGHHRPGRAARHRAVARRGLLVGAVDPLPAGRPADTAGGVAHRQPARSPSRHRPRPPGLGRRGPCAGRRGRGVRGPAVGGGRQPALHRLPRDRLVQPVGDADHDVAQRPDAASAGLRLGADRGEQSGSARRPSGCGPAGAGRP